MTFPLPARFCLLIVLGLAASAPTFADETAELRPQWVEGQTALYEFWFQRTDDVTVSFRGNTRNMQSLLTTEGQTRWTVDKVNDDGSAVCQMTIEWCTATAEADGIKQTNDSRKAAGDNEMMHRLLKTIAGTPLTVHVNADGSIKSVEGIDAMKRKVGKDYEEIIPDALDFVESASEMASIPYSPEILAPGDEFDAEYRWTHDLGHTDQEWAYTLSGVENLEGVPVATLTGEGSYTLDVDESELPNDGPPIDIKMTQGKGQTQIFFDMDRREAVGRHSTSDETVRVTVTLPDGGGKLERTIVRSSQSQTLRIEAE